VLGRAGGALEPGGGGGGDGGGGGGGGLVVRVDAKRAEAWAPGLGAALMAEPHTFAQELSEWLSVELSGGRVPPEAFEVSVRPVAPPLPLESVGAVVCRQSAAALREAIYVAGMVVAEASISQRVKVCCMRCTQCSKELSAKFLPLGPPGELQNEAHGWCCGVGPEAYEEDTHSRTYAETKAVLLGGLHAGAWEQACEPLEVVLEGEMTEFSLGDAILVLGRPRLLERQPVCQPREGSRYERKLVVYATNAELAPAQMRMEKRLDLVRAMPPACEALPGSPQCPPSESPTILSAACDLAALTGLREGTAAALILSASSLIGCGTPLNLVVATAAPADSVLAGRLRQAAALLLPFSEILRPLQQCSLLDGRLDFHEKKAATSWRHSGQASRAQGGGLLLSLDGLRSKAEVTRALHELMQHQRARAAQGRGFPVLWAHAAKSDTDDLLPQHVASGAFQGFVVCSEDSDDMHTLEDMDEAECAQFSVELLQHMVALTRSALATGGALSQLPLDGCRTVLPIPTITPEGEALVREYFLIARANAPAAGTGAHLGEIGDIMAMAAASARFDGRSQAEAWPDCALAALLADAGSRALRGASLWGGEAVRPGEALPAAITRVAERLARPLAPLGAPGAPPAP